MAIAAALCAALSARVDAADYVVTTEAELRAAIITANGDGDPGSTITLGNDLTISDPDPLPESTKPLSIVAGNNQLSLAPAAPVDGTGTILHTGAGTTIMAGESSYTGTLRIRAGTLVIQAGAQVSGTSQLYLGDTAGQSGTLAVTGSGSYLSLTGTFGQTVVGRVGTGVLNIDAGAIVDAAALQVADGIGNGTVNVTGAGSTLSVTGSTPLFIAAVGQGTLNILNGGRVTTAGGGCRREQRGGTGDGPGVRLGLQVGDHGRLQLAQRVAVRVGWCIRDGRQHRSGNRPEQVVRCAGRWHGYPPGVRRHLPTRHHCRRNRGGDHR
jgi:fibronectin-binding autotransporter adhesin